MDRSWSHVSSLYQYLVDTADVLVELELVQILFHVVADLAAGDDIIECVIQIGIDSIKAIEFERRESLPTRFHAMAIVA